MSKYSKSNGRVARNTAFLYFRMLFLIMINLYTIRITLNILGAEDYGIYNVVASVVTSLSFLNGSMTSATQRFLSFHLGKNNYELYSKTFSIMLMGFIIISFFIIIISELFSPFIVYDWLTIPIDKRDASMWVFQTAVFSFIFNLITIPYTSSIVANEKMSAFAYISIVDGILKLLIVYLLLISDSNRLIRYSFFSLGEILVILIIYIIYCHKKFKYCKIQIIWDKNLFKELTLYTGWNLFGSVSGILTNQGQNILLNIFFGPLINTAKAIADKISHVVRSFSSNFYMAVSPQIIKSYAAAEYERMHILSLKSSRLSYFLLLIISSPLILEMNPLLNLWLGESEVTNSMVCFAQLSLINCLVSVLEQPITQMIRATGKIKNYQVKVGTLTFIYIPIAAVILHLGASAVSTLIIQIILVILVQIVRVYIAHREVNLDYKCYNNEVVFPIIKVSILSIFAYFIINCINLKNNIVLLILKLSTSLILEGCLIWFLGLKKRDRQFICRTIKAKFIDTHNIHN